MNVTPQPGQILLGCYTVQSTLFFGSAMIVLPPFNIEATTLQDAMAKLDARAKWLNEKHYSARLVFTAIEAGAITVPDKLRMERHDLLAEFLADTFMNWLAE